MGDTSERRAKKGGKNMAYLDKVKLADYTRKEDWLNSISHMVGGGLSVVALLMCCIKSIILRRWDYLLFLSFIARHHHDSYVFVLFGLPRIAP